MKGKCGVADRLIWIYTSFYDSKFVFFILWYDDGRQTSEKKGFLKIWMTIKNLSNAISKTDFQFAFGLHLLSAPFVENSRKMMSEATGTDFKQTKWIYFEGEIVKPHATLKPRVLCELSVILCWIGLHTTHCTNLPNWSSLSSAMTTITNRQ